MNDKTQNPYVGPRTFLKEEGHLFFGRDREARDLSALVVSENLVLFYAQSGAGKSSLINTRLIPELEENEYEVLPVARVSGELPEGLELENVFIYNLMRSLIRREIDAKSLSNLSLSQFLGKLNEDDDGYFYDTNAESSYRQNTGFAPWPRALVIDQFEEIFSTHLDSWEKREDFFSQLAQAMKDDPYLWVVLVMRDDYIALLDPYAHLLPGGLRTRYYMQRFSRESAIKAIKGPVEDVRPYDEGVAEELVENLASITTQTPDGNLSVQPGQYVEPVQLQVVCYGLWENLIPGGKKITANDLQEVGNVDQSLENFYDHRVESVAKEKGVSERLVREWFGSALITSSGTRNMLLRESGQIAGLSVAVIESFKGDLVRAELRAGQIWYELSHDRLIEPVRRSNEKWFEQHLSLFQRRVMLWVEQGQSDSLLLRDKELDKAEQEAARLQLTTDEEEFLEECRELRVRIQRDRNQRRVIMAALIVSVALLIIAGISYFRARDAEVTATKAQISAEAEKIVAQEAEAAAQESAAEALEQKGIAEEQANKALAGSLAAYADSIKNNDHALALLLGVEAYQREATLLSRTTLFNLLQFTPSTRYFGFEGPVTSIVISPDGKRAAVSSLNEVSILDLETNQVISSLTTDMSLVKSLAISPDGNLLTIGGCLPGGCQEPGGQLSLWDISNPEAALQLADIRDGHSAQIKTVAFSPDGKIIASGSYDRTIRLWDVSDSNALKPLGAALRDQDRIGFVTTIAFSPDGNTLVSGGDDRLIQLWDVSDPANSRLISNAPAQHEGPIYSITFGPAGSEKFASASDDKTVVLWDWNPGPDVPVLTNPVILEGHEGFVRGVAFNADGTRLASTGFDASIILWDVETMKQIGPALSVHTRPVNTIAFGTVSTQDLLISGGDDNTIVLWNRSTRQPLSQPDAETTMPEDIGETAIQGDLEAIANGQQIEVRDGSGVSNILSGHTGVVNSVSFSPQRVDGKILLASASNDQSVIIWDLSDIATWDVFLKLGSFETPVQAAFFSPDGRQLISVDKTGEAIRWTIEPAEWLERACMAAGRSLTELEWEQYLPGQEYRDSCKAFSVNQ